MSGFTIIIPARYASTRLPGKMLADIQGKPMIVRVYEQALQARAGRVIVATDDQRIADVLLLCGAEVVMTDVSHSSGTLRIAEVIQQKKINPETIIVNLQGDLPLIHPKLILQLADDQLLYPESDISTLAEPMTELSSF